MWRKLSFYRQTIILTVFSAAFVYLLVSMKRRTPTTKTSIQLQPDRYTPAKPGLRTTTSRPASAQKNAKIQITDHMSPTDANSVFTKITPATKQKETPIKPKPSARKQSADDLTLIQGIGPKTAAALRNAGVQTFNALSELDEQKLNSILRDQSIRATRTETWPRQAIIAAKGDLKKLKEFQASL